MKIQNLSTKYMVRKLNDADIEKVYEVMQIKREVENKK